MSNSKPTFKYIQVNVIGAIKTLERLHENLLFGGFSCAVIEFLGKCLNGPQSTNQYKNFCTFIERFLKKYNLKYEKHKYLLWKDLRNGAAHSMMPKGFCILSFHPTTENLHLELVKDINTNKCFLQIHTPQFLKDLKCAVMDFVSDVQEDSVIGENYMKVLEQISKENKDIISEEYRKDAIEISMKGDISL